MKNPITVKTGKPTKKGLTSTAKRFTNQKAFRESFGVKIVDGKTVYEMGNAEAKRQWVALMEGPGNDLNVEGRKLATENPIVAVTKNATESYATLRIALPKARKTTSGRRPGKVASLENEIAALKAQIALMSANVENPVEKVA